MGIIGFNSCRQLCGVLLTGARHFENVLCYEHAWKTLVPKILLTRLIHRQLALQCVECLHLAQLVVGIIYFQLTNSSIHSKSFIATYTKRFGPNNYRTVHSSARARPAKCNHRSTKRKIKVSWRTLLKFKSFFEN